MRNNVAIENRSEFGQKRIKKLEKAPKSLIFARHCRAKWSARRLNVATLIPATKYGKARILLSLSKLPYFAFLGLVGVLGRFRSSIGTQGVFVAYTGIFTAEKKKA